MATILIVDDDDGFLEMLGAVLTHAGYQVQKASNGQQAVSLYENRQTDLVITDLVMPGKEGIELIAELKRLNSDARIIAISGVGRDPLSGYLRMAKALGAQRVLAKPFSEQEILEAVTEVLLS